jgi:hypothetical protein
MVKFGKFIPVNQDGTPALRRVPINVEQICLILPGDRPGHSILALSGGMQIMVAHTELDVCEIIDEAFK